MGKPTMKRASYFGDIMQEEWRVAKRFPMYLVSNLGNVKHISNHRNPNNKTLKPWKERAGYLVLKIRSPLKHRAKKAINVRIHTLVAEAFLGKRPKGKSHVNHKDCNKANNYADNLEYTTPLENNHHAHRNGRYPKVDVAGDKNPNRKLSSEDVKTIRKQTKGLSAKRKYGLVAKLIEKYKVHSSTMSRVINKKGWKNIE